MLSVSKMIVDITLEKKNLNNMSLRFEFCSVEKPCFVSLRLRILMQHSKHTKKLRYQLARR